MTEAHVADQLLATDLHVEATSRLMEALVESENRMRRRLELLADAVIETSSDGALVFLNPAWESLTGRASRDCLGRTVESFFPEDCRARRPDGARPTAPASTRSWRPGSSTRTDEPSGSC